MRFNAASVGSEPAALVFPGQGTHDFSRLNEFRTEPSYQQRLEIICSLLGSDPLAGGSSGDGMITDNAESSLLTILASTLALDRWWQTDATNVVAVAGYSVGQWTALYAAGMIDVVTLFRTVHARASFMDQCVPRGSGGMLAVIGVRETDLQHICKKVGDKSLVVEIANYNAPLHFTLSGTIKALDEIEPQIRSLRPKVLVRPPVAGPWHSSLLRKAVPAFREQLETIPIGRPLIPVIDNVTGDWFPDDHRRLRDNLALHLAVPVQWRSGVETMIDSGARTLVEIGLGNTLTKYDFFVSRKARHVAPFALPVD